MFKKFISLLLSLELFLSFAGANILFLNTAVAAQACSSGQVFSASLNRCVLEKEVIGSKLESQNCQNIDGPEREACFKEVANRELKDTPASADAKSKMMIPMVVTLGAGIALFRRSALLGTCGSISLPLLAAGGATSLIGEFMAQNKYKGKLEDLEEKYKDRMKNDQFKDKEIADQATMNQVIAFDYQIDQERAKSSAHKSRKVTYTLSSLMYGGAAIAAIIDIAKQYGVSATGCVASMELPDHLNYTPSRLDNIKHIAQIIYDNSFNFFPSAKAASAVVGMMNMLPATAAKVVIPSGEAVITPASRNYYITAAVAGILAGHSMSVAKKAGEEKDKAEARIKALEKLKKDFLAAGGAGFGLCTEEDRSSPSKPSCYCYMEDGSRNPKRAKSSVCLATYGQATDLTASNYSLSATGYSTEGVKGCSTRGGEIDTACKCKEVKDPKNDKSCFQISGNLNLGPLSTNNDFAQAVGHASDFVNGNISTGELDSANLQNLAARINIKKNDLLGKNKKTKKIKDKILKLEKKINRGLSSRVAKDYKAGRLAGLDSGLFSGDSEAIAVKPVEILKKVKTIKAPTAIGLSGSKSKSKKSDYDFDFGDSEGGVSVDEGVDPHIEGNTEYAINDINGNKHHNIFKIISNRYLSSGLPHLFGNANNIKIEKPGKTEINDK